MNNTVIKQKSFLNLCNHYYQKFVDGVSLDEAILKLTTEECIYLYNKDIEAEDLKNQTGLIEKDEDILENWKALAFAIYKFFDKEKIGHEVIDPYILEFINNNEEEILGIPNEKEPILRMTNNN